MIKITPYTIKKYLLQNYPNLRDSQINKGVDTQFKKVSDVLHTYPVKEATITVKWIINTKLKQRLPIAICKYKTTDGKTHIIQSTKITNLDYDLESTAVGRVLETILLPNYCLNRTLIRNEYVTYANDGYHLPKIYLASMGIKACDFFVKELGGMWISKKDEYKIFFK